MHGSAELMPPVFWDGSKIRLLRTETQQDLERLIESIIKKPKSYVEYVVWKLTYLGDKSTFAMLVGEDLTSQQIREIRDEIFRKYSLKHDHWSFNKKYQNSIHRELESYRALSMAAKGDRITIRIVIERIENYMKKTNGDSLDVIYQTIKNLKSESECMQLRGLRQLGFGYNEADFLKPCSNAIGAMTEELLYC